ncbi:MAG TPA: VanW family protein [Atribacteraceae bacterium]|nr:VanW family protein [Atribacteraceae bacterium]
MRNVRLLLIVCTTLGILAGALVLGNPFPGDRKNTVLGRSLRGLRSSEIILFLQILEEKWLEKPFSLILDGKTLPIEKQRLGIRFDMPRMRNTIRQSQEGEISLRLLWDEQAVEELLRSIAEQAYRAPVDARMEDSVIIPSQPGRSLNVKKSKSRLKEALSNGFVEIPVEDFNVQQPYRTTEILMVSLGLPHLLASHTTSLAGRNEETLFNIRKASNSISGLILEPGEEFSFNQVVGPAEKEDGYQKGWIVVSGRLVPGYGGGICQVSSTLFNALLQTGAKVLERSPHSGFSETTSYVLPGRDAAVSYGFKDLRFRFSGQRTAILALIQEDSLITEVWGEEENRINRRLETSIVDFLETGQGEGFLYVRTVAYLNEEKEFEYHDRYRICADLAHSLIAKL